MAQKRWIAAFLLLTIILSACGTPPADVATKPTTEATTEATTEETTEETTVPEPVITKITISAAGDVTLGTNQLMGYSGTFHQYYDRFGSDYFLKNVRDVFEKDDFTIVNLEGTLTNATKPMDKLYNHKGKPEYINILKNSSVEAVTLGNNHIMDYLQKGADDTMAAVAGANMEYALSGDWGNRFGLYETKGIKIGFVSVNEHYDGTRVYQWLEEGLNTLRQQGADLVFACVHWGGDKTHTPEKAQYTMGKWCIDKGFDLVLGCHPHVLQGIEYYKGRYIVHSMGNFCYGGNLNPKEKDSMIYQQTFTFVDGVHDVSQDEVTVIPCRLSSVTTTNDYCPTVLTGSKGEAVLKNLNAYSKEFGTVFDMDGKIISKKDSAR